MSEMDRDAPAGAIAVTTDPAPPHRREVWVRTTEYGRPVWHRLQGTGQTVDELDENLVEWVAWPAQTPYSALRAAWDPDRPEDGVTLTVKYPLKELP